MAAVLEALRCSAVAVADGGSAVEDDEEDVEDKKKKKKKKKSKRGVYNVTK